VNIPEGSTPVNRFLKYFERFLNGFDHGWAQNNTDEEKDQKNALLKGFRVRNARGVKGQISDFLCF